jgi:hypothetical protein
MTVRLENLTSRPVWLVLASGESLRLAPGQKSDALPDVEVSGSPKVQALTARGVVRPDKDNVRSAPERRASRRGPKSDVNP